MKGLVNVISAIFLGDEHRECMRHLTSNFMKKFKGKIFQRQHVATTYMPIIQVKFHKLIIFVVASGGKM
jgi:hypothetical protein